MRSVQISIASIALITSGFAASYASANSKASKPDGRQLVQQSCGTCHTLGKGEKSAEGPALYGVVGRKAGTMPGFNYTPEFRKALGGKTWTPQLLDRFLTDSQVVAPNSGMVFFNDSPAQRKAIIDYLSKH